MAYEHDIFISYRRTPTVGLWVKNHLAPRLELRINDISGEPVRVFCDFMMADGVNWPEELKNRVRRSRLMVTVWSADYFRSPWCMAEWRSFRDREEQLGLFNARETRGLVYPVRYADGDHYHPDAQNTQCQKDFTELNYPDEVFRVSAKYLEFDDLVRAMARDLVARLSTIPEWDPNFPIVEPPPMGDASMDRPVL